MSDGTYRVQVHSPTMSSSYYDEEYKYSATVTRLSDDKQISIYGPTLDRLEEKLRKDYLDGRFINQDRYDASVEEAIRASKARKAAENARIEQLKDFKV